MRIWSKPEGISHPRLLFALVLIAGLLLPAIPAQAIIGVEETDNGHRYVGTVWRIDPLATIPPDEVHASGILIAPNVVLTAAERFRNGRRVAVSFESPVEDFEDYGTTVYRGYVFNHPEFGGFQAFPGSYSHENNFDMAVIILDEEVQGVTPANLAGIGALDALKGTKGQKQGLTAVGYGSTTGGFKEHTFDFARRAAAWELSGLKQSYVHTKALGQAGPCDGDQGGPILTESETVAALIVNWDGICGAKGVGLGYRVDTTDAHEFFCFVSETDLDTEEIEDPNSPVIEGDFVDYPAVTQDSAAVLDDFCEPGVRTASADDGGKQRADDGGKQKADRNHKHKKGGQHRNEGKRRG